MSTRILILKDGVITPTKTSSDRQLALNSLISTMTANRVIRSDGTNLVLAQVDLTKDVIGVLPTANGGTGNSASYVDLTSAQTIGGLKTFSDGLILPATVHSSVGAIWRNGNNLEFRNNANTVQIILNSAGNLSNLADKQTSLNNLVGTQTANRVLRSDGTNVTLSQVNLVNDTTGTLPISLGGTGSSTQNFVDITTNQTIAGVKTFSNTTASTSTTTGGVIIGGGLGIAGRLSAATGYFTSAMGIGSQTVDFTNSTIKFGIGTSGQDAILAMHVSGAGFGVFAYDLSDSRFIVGSASNQAIDLCTNVTGNVGADNLVNATPTLRIIGANVVFSRIPTSSSGLTTGMVWRNGNVLNIV